MDPWQVKLECLKLAARNEHVASADIVESARRFYDWIIETEGAGSATARPADTPRTCPESIAA